MTDMDAKHTNSALTHRGPHSLVDDPSPTDSFHPGGSPPAITHAVVPLGFDPAIHFTETQQRKQPSEAFWQACSLDATLSAAHNWPGEAVHDPSALPSLSGQADDGADGPATITRFGDYELLEEIARGGMGVVYKARQTKLDRIVALKMILGGRFADPTEVRSLYQEAETVARLDHPNIVRVHEVGEHQGHHYFSMDYVEGPTLGEIVRESRPGFLEAARMVRVLARAIHYAHTSGVLHRDLKPSNILVDRRRRLRITDFGVAKRINQTSAATTAGRVTGTPAYMPPEQAAGTSTAVGPHSDVYGLGAILYELLSGRPPFTGATTVDVLAKVQEDDPVRPSLLEPTVPRDLETICLTCLAKDPRRRYATAEHLAADLDRFLAHQKIKARPPSGWQLTVKWCRRSPVLATALMLVGLMIVVGGVGLLWHSATLAYEKELKHQAANLAEAERRKAEHQREIAQRETTRARSLLLEAEEQRQRAEQRELEARRYLYAVRMNDIQLAWQQADMRRVNELLNELRPKPGQVDLRGFEWFYFWQLGHSDRATFDAHQGLVSSVAYSPDGTRLATAGLDGAFPGSRAVQ